MNIIFHYPLPLDPAASSASGIRPLKMLEAFKSLGCSVDIISGYSYERKEKIVEIKKKIASGFKYQFVYSESSTMPTILTDTHHLPLHPRLDFDFFKLCKNHNIPIGLFYRDIYWAFDSYEENLNKIKVTLGRLSYKYDLINYNKYLTKFYLPSIEMGEYIPIVSKSIFAALPPAHDADLTELNSDVDPTFTDKLKVFYVGGMSDHYQMHKLVSVVNQRTDIELTICTRASEWLAIKPEYPEILHSNRIKVVHKSGEKMRELMLNADITSLFVKPHEYWSFAVPVKLFEYLGNQKPIIASEGTLAGKFVTENNIGWTIPYNENALHDLFDNLMSEPKIYIDIKHHMHKVAKQHTWQARAKQVIQDLS